MIALIAALPIVVWDFAVGPQGFTASGDVGQWEHGVPTSGPGGPAKVWATNLAGFYLNDATDHLEVPVPALTGVVRPTIVFRHWYAIAAGDFAYVEVDPGSGWVRVDPIYGYPQSGGFTGISEWTNVSVDLTEHGTNPRVRFSFTSDLSVADDGWYLSEVALWDGDATPPLVTPILEPRDTQDLDGPYAVQVQVEDDEEVGAVALVWSVGAVESTVSMIENEEGAYEGEIPGQGPDTIVSWRVEASDTAGNVAGYPVGTEQTFRVFLAAPQELALSDDERPIGDSVQLTWLPPESPHEVIGYQVQDVGGTREPVEADGTAIELQIGPDDPQTWWVSAVYPAGVGDWSEPIELGLEVPELLEVEPETGIQGDTVHVRVVGSSLYLVDGASWLDLGVGVDVVSVEVVDANTLDAVVVVEPDAEPGLREVTVEGGQGAFTFVDAFEVLDESARPTIVSVTPSNVRQGDDAVLTIAASQVFAGPIEVETDDEIVLTNAAVVDGAEVQLSIVVNQSAVPGEHTVVLDDGVRRFTATFVVDERVYSVTTRGCAVAPAGGLGALGLVMAGLLAQGGAARRRRRAEPPTGTESTRLRSGIQFRAGEHG